MVKVGSARISENGNAGWDGKAKAGDQTGKEVSTQDWYLHSKGWVLLRAKDEKVAEKIAKDMQYACDNNNIGYDQSERDTLYNVAKKVGFDCSKVTTKCETDCSALVRVCICYAGIDCPNIRTNNLADTLVKTGAFTKYTAKKYTESSDYLMRGDILCTKTTGHVVVVLSDGAKITRTKKVMATKDPESFDKYLKGAYITTGNLNMRNGAGVTNRVLKVIPKGTKVYNYGYYTKVAKTSWLWVNTTLGDTEYTGYCSERYLQKC